jgi:hypothetical protein
LGQPFHVRGRAARPLNLLEGVVPTRRIFELIVITNVLFWPARSTIRLWGKKQLAVRDPGTVLHGVGEVLVTLL